MFLSYIILTILNYMKEFRTLLKAFTHLIFRFKGLVPIQFLTGFYVGEVFRRFWDQFMSLPWPDRIAFKLVSNIPGTVSKIFMKLVNFALVSNISYFGTCKSTGRVVPFHVEFSFINICAIMIILSSYAATYKSNCVIQN